MRSAEATGQERVGPYRVIKAIGAGGSARIDLARVERAYGFERDIVLKRPLEHLRTSGAVAATLRREASLGGRLRHPNIVAVLDAGEHDGYDYLALEYVRGVSLRDATQTGPGELARLPLDAALSIVIDVASGLHFAHELLGDDGLPLGLVHRDVSPGNVLIAYDGTVKLSDFGIAKDTHVDTLSGSLRGTVTYMAPEQCRGHAFDRRADVFSLGVILHELITGRRLFWADNDVASLHRVLSGTIPDPRELDPRISKELAAIAMHALARDAGDRIACAKDLADRLEAYASRAGILTGPRTIQRGLARERLAAELARLSAAKLLVTTTEPAPSLVDVITGAPDEADLVMPEHPTLVMVEHPTPTVVLPEHPTPVWSGRDEDGAPPEHPEKPEHPTLPRDAPAPIAPRPTGRARSRTLAIVIGASAAIGVVIAILATRESSPTSRPTAEPAKPDDPSTSADPARPMPKPDDPSTSADPARTITKKHDESSTPADPARAITQQPDEPSRPVDPARPITQRPGESTPVDPARPTTPKKPDKSTTRQPTTEPAKPAVVRTRPPAAPPPPTRVPARATETRSDPRVSTKIPPDAGSGSNARKLPPKKVEWSPEILLPSDLGSRNSPKR